jgi:hypothetical protein
MSTIEASPYLSQASASGGRPPRRLLLGMMLAVFFSGGVIGSGSTLMVINRRIAENEKHYDPIIVGQKVAKELEEKLSLSEEQAAKVDRIMKDHMAAIDLLRREVIFPRMREQFEQMKDQVDAVLDDQQRAQYHGWLEERRKRVCPPPGSRGNGTHRRPGKDADAAKPATQSESSQNADATGVEVAK